MNPIDKLLAIEAIKVVKAQYFRFVDTKDWEGLRSIFTPDAAFEVPEARQGVSDLEESLVFFAQALEGAVSVHFGHMPEIVIDTETSAHAIWPMDDRIYWSPERASILGYSRLRGFGHYHETYERLDGEWKIKTLRLTRVRLMTETPPRAVG